MIEVQESLQVIAEASNGKEVLEQIPVFHPDIALVDVDMPVLDGFDTVRAISRLHPSVKVVFLTFYRDEMHLNEALNLGAHGYLVKDSVAADVVQCLRTVAGGNYYITPALSSHLIKNRQQLRTELAKEKSELSSLTATERRILAQLAGYKTNKQIATEFGISIRTVENHRANICDKLGLQGAHALVRFAIEKGNCL